MNIRFGMLVAIAILGLVVVSQRERLGRWILARGMESAMSADATAELDDGLHVALCGAGGPMTDPRRSGPCVAAAEARAALLESRSL